MTTKALESGTVILAAIAGTPTWTMARHEEANFAQGAKGLTSSPTPTRKIYSATTTVMLRVIKVAQAAPAKPSFGMPNKPKIKMGSSVALKIAATPIRVPWILLNPMARSEASATMGTSRQGALMYQMLMY